MLLEMGLIVGGVPAGWLLRANRQAHAAVGFILTWAVRLLLFLLGLSLGADDILLGRIQELGLQAAVISSLAMCGCLSVAWLMGSLFQQLDKKRHSHGKDSSAVLDAEFDDIPAVHIPTPQPRCLLRRIVDKIPMKGSLLVLVFFFVGVVAGWQGWLSQALAQSHASLWTLYILLFSAGMGVGFDLKALGIIRELKGRIFLVPLGVAVGTLAGSAVAWVVLSFVLPGKIALPEALAVGAGFGYYSLATVIITNMGDPALGSVALLSNMIHELIALTLSPLIVRMVGKLGPVMAGGAAAMDTCLPVIAKYSGERYAIVAVFSGVALTLLVPILVPALMSLR